MKNTQKTANKLPMPGKVKKGFRFYCVAVLSVALVLAAPSRPLPPMTRLPS